MTVNSNDGWKATGRTRWRMKGLLWSKPALQLEETTNWAEMETNTFSTMSSVVSRWRWVNEADKLNLKEVLR